MVIRAYLVVALLALVPESLDLPKVQFLKVWHDETPHLTTSAARVDCRLRLVHGSNQDCWPLSLEGGSLRYGSCHLVDNCVACSEPLFH